MMHDREKSDPATVAGKPTNKAVSTAAESVQPRAGAKGNASQQSTHRTQGRERVSDRSCGCGRAPRGSARTDGAVSTRGQPLRAALVRGGNPSCLRRDSAQAQSGEQSARRGSVPAIATAQQQKARSFELRAALALAKLYQSTGRPADAHAVRDRVSSELRCTVSDRRVAAEGAARPRRS